MREYLLTEICVAAWDREQGWSSGGENSDGGMPVAPHPSNSAAKKGPNSQSQSRAKINTPWRQPNQNVNPPEPSQQTSWGAPALKQPSFQSALPPLSGREAPKSKSWGGGLPSETRKDTKLADLMKNTKTSTEKSAEEKKGAESSKPNNDDDLLSW